MQGLILNTFILLTILFKVNTALNNTNFTSNDTLNLEVLSQWQDITSKYIDISNRSITYIEPSTFSNLTQLEQLYVNNNF